MLGINFLTYASPSDSLNNQLQNTIQSYLKDNTKSLHISAVQLSILLPGEAKPRGFVVGTKYYNSFVPATTNMFMQWGSITKEYTDVLIVKLINSKKINAEETLVQLFPENFSNSIGSWPSVWKQVTVVQLMNMTSGIPEYQQIIPNEMAKKKIQFDPYRQYSLAELVNAAANYQKQNNCDQFGCFRAGSHWYYSNTNYIILGMIIEKYSHQSLSQAFNKLLQPFQKEGCDVFYYDKPYPKFLLEKMIHGYGFYSMNPSDPLRWGDVTDWNMSFVASAGAMLGNSSALAKVSYALYHDQMVPTKQMLQYAVQMTNGQPATNPSKQCGEDTGCYALGIAMAYAPEDGGMLYYYVGSTEGYTAEYMWIPSEQVMIAVAQNAKGNSLARLTLTINRIVRHRLLS